MAFNDYRPEAAHHLLVIPKRHVGNAIRDPTLGLYAESYQRASNHSPQLMWRWVNSHVYAPDFAHAVTQYKRCWRLATVCWKNEVSQRTSDGEIYQKLRIHGPLTVVQSGISHTTVHICTTLAYPRTRPAVQVVPGSCAVPNSSRPWWI